MSQTTTIALLVHGEVQSCGMGIRFEGMVRHWACARAISIQIYVGANVFVESRDDDGEYGIKEIQTRTPNREV